MMNIYLVKTALSLKYIDRVLRGSARKAAKSPVKTKKMRSAIDMRASRQLDAMTAGKLSPYKVKPVFAAGTKNFKIFGGG